MMSMDGSGRAMENGTVMKVALLTRCDGAALRVILTFAYCANHKIIASFNSIATIVII